MNRRDALKLFAGTPAAAALEKLPEIREVERAVFRPGDVLVVTIEDLPVNDLALARMQRLLGRAFPGVRIVVLPPGVAFHKYASRGFLSPEEIGKRERDV